MILTGILLLMLVLLGAPLFSVIAASAMLGFYNSEIDLSIMAIEFFGLSEMPILVAIPLFTFAPRPSLERPSRLASRWSCDYLSGVLRAVYGVHGCFWGNDYCPGGAVISGACRGGIR